MIGFRIVCYNDFGDIMGLFSKIKNLFQGVTEDTVKDEVIDTKEERKVSLEEEREEIKEEVKILTQEDKKSVKIYEKGLTKSRHEFVSKLADLTKKYKNIDEDYFEDLEEILIMADIGVNTVMEFVDRLKDRVKKEKIESPEMLKEIIVDGDTELVGQD